MNRLKDDLDDFLYNESLDSFFESQTLLGVREQFWSRVGRRWFLSCSACLALIASICFLTNWNIADQESGDVTDVSNRLAPEELINENNVNNIVSVVNENVHVSTTLNDGDDCSLYSRFQNDVVDFSKKKISIVRDGLNETLSPPFSVNFELTTSDVGASFCSGADCEDREMKTKEEFVNVYESLCSDASVLQVDPLFNIVETLFVPYFTNEY